jgi:hypothetical protein
MSQEPQKPKEDRLMDLLFHQEGRTLVNVKFCRGDGDKVTEADLREQMHSALMQRRMRTADVSTDFAEDEKTIDVRELVASL